MQSLEEFYDFMQRLHTARRSIVASCLSRTNDPQDIGVIQNAIKVIDNLPGSGYTRSLEIDGNTLDLELDYERRELERDAVFLDRPIQEFYQTLANDHQRFSESVGECLEFLRDRDMHTFITDRDGTINNYCGHYRSSHQSIYNAVFLTHFIRRCTSEAVILTSAPLEPHGIIDLSAMPERTVTLAGSKGRELLTADGRRASKPIAPGQAEALQTLNERLEQLLEHKRNRPFALIGSGLQYKFGQTTVARQDIHGSVAAQESQRFLQSVTELVQELDPSGSTFQIEDTGKDVEIMLTVEGEREFSKGDGVAFLAEELPLDLDGSSCALVCGDTGSDVPMLEEVIARAGAANTATVFVTTDTELRRRVSTVAGDHWFVDSPDVLVVALNRLASEQAR
jgi:hypothetical protein